LIEHPATIATQSLPLERIEVEQLALVDRTRGRDETEVLR